jgi:predicted alpha/beta superfamily hydrolase
VGGLPISPKTLWAEAFGQGENLPVVYCLTGEGMREQLPEIRGLVTPALEQGICRPFILAGFGPVEWSRDYTPWPAPALSSGDAFSGGGAATLEWLRSTGMPALRRLWPEASEDAYLLGYSLGGLCALWMLYQGDDFAGCASCSGSLWYDGWTEYARTHPLPRPGSRIYLSLGKKEEKARNRRMAAVGVATRDTFAFLQEDSHVAETMLDWQDGGHFHDIPGRLAKAILWLMKPG